MGNFTINILHPTPNYNRISSTLSIDKCTDATLTRSVGLIGHSGYNLLSSYSGDQAAKVVITSISYDTGDENTTGARLKYNSNVLTNDNLPLEIDISAVNSGDAIPNLEYEVDQIKFNTISNVGDESFVVIHFYVETIEDVAGPTINSLFKILRTPCLTPVNPTISNLTEVTNGGGAHAQSFRITGEANTTYKLKVLFKYDDRTGAYTASLENTDNSSLFAGLPPLYPIDNVVIDYTTNGSGIINMEFTIEALSSFLDASAELGEDAVQNCVKAKLTLYKADGITLALTESVIATACTTLLDLGGDDDFFNDDGGGRDLEQFF